MRTPHVPDPGRHWGCRDGWSGQGSPLGSTWSILSVPAPPVTERWALGQGLGLRGRVKAGSDLRNSDFIRGLGDQRITGTKSLEGALPLK